MSRIKKAFKGIASSYLLLVVAALYSFVSIPLALHYLDKGKFGLWVLVGSIAGYFNLIDLGITGASVRLFMDHKDQRDGGAYGSLIKSSWCVALAQGIIVIALGALAARILGPVLKIEATLEAEFTKLFFYQCLILAFTFATRMPGLILDAHQRMDLVNYSSIAGLLIGLLVQYLGFRYGCGIYSLILAGSASTVLNFLLQGSSALILNLFPEKKAWGSIDRKSFGELFAFGGNLFLMSLGAQMIMSSQSIVITRALGLDAAATWGIGTRVFNMINPVIWRIYDMSSAALAEMMVRGEGERLRDRYRSLFILTLSLAVLFAAVFSSSNRLFLNLWTHGKITWPASCDLLLGFGIVFAALIHCNCGFTMLTKRIGLMKYVYFLEGITFITASFYASPRYGLAGVIACSSITSLVFSGLYGSIRVCNYFGIGCREYLSWMRPSMIVALMLVPFALAVYFLSLSAAVSLRFLLNSTIISSAGLLLLWKFGLPEFLNRKLQKRFNLH